MENQVKFIRSKRYDVMLNLIIDIYDAKIKSL